MRMAEKIKQLIAAGVPAGEVAKRVGTSRQYVYALCKKEGVKLPAPFVRPTAGPPPKPRAPNDPQLTGGVPAKIGTATMGRVAELLAAADLLARGWHVFLPIYFSQGFDIVAAKEGRIITVEVRSGARRVMGNVYFTKKPSDKSTHYACVMTGEPVQYFPPLDSHDLFG